MSNVNLNIGAKIDTVSVDASLQQVKDKVAKASASIKVDFKTDNWNSAISSLKQQMRKLKINASDLIDVSDTSQALQKKINILQERINKVGTDYKSDPDSVDVQTIEKLKTEMLELNTDVLKVKTNMSDMDLNKNLLNSLDAMKDKLETFKTSNSDIMGNKNISSQFDDIINTLNVDVSHSGDLTNSVLENTLSNAKAMFSKLEQTAKQTNIELKIKTNAKETQNDLKDYLSTVKSQIASFQLSNSEATSTPKIKQEISTLKGYITRELNNISNISGEKADEIESKVKHSIEQIKLDAKSENIKIDLNADTETAQKKVLNYISTLKNQLASIEVSNVDVVDTDSVKPKIDEIKSIMANTVENVKNLSINDINEVITNLKGKIGELRVSVKKEKIDFNLEIDKEKLISDIKDTISAAQPQALQKNDLLGQYDSLITRISNATTSSDIKKARIEVGKLDTQLKEASDTGRTFEQVLQAAFQRFSAFSIASYVINQVINAVKSAISYVTELDATMTEFRYVTGMSKDEVDDLRSSFTKLGTEIGATTEEVADGALTWIDLQV